MVFFERKNMITRIQIKSLLLLITALLCVFVMTSCGQNDNTKNANSNAENATEQQAEETDSATAKEQRIEEIMADMSLKEKIGQMMMADFRFDGNGNPVTSINDSIASDISEYHLGGVILFSENMSDYDTTKQLIYDMQSNADMPMLIGIDEEGGIVSRLDNSTIPHDSVLPAADMNGDTETAESSGNSIGKTLKSLGINLDFAPVADVNTNPNNPVIGDRAYGSDPDTVSDMASAFATGLKEAGVNGVAKHFPGHGDTATDSHAGAATSYHDMVRLEEIEFKPFQRLIDDDIPCVLVGHISLPEVTGNNTPATLSKEIVDILRNDLNFDGVAITDAMNMGAIMDYYYNADAAVMAVEAGMDILLMPPNLEHYQSALVEAVESGRISESRIDESVERILSLKFDSGLIE